MFDDGELRNKLIETGLRRSSLFSWHKTASETLEVYKKLL
jgi:glycosyltransferase involved in cell wall biosynthesis